MKLLFTTSKSQIPTKGVLTSGWVLTARVRYVDTADTVDVGTAGLGIAGETDVVVA